MDKIVGDNFTNYRKCIDDTLLFDVDISTNFDTICRFLTKFSSKVVIFNPKKFQFAETIVKFPRFVINDSGIQPTSEFIQTIMDFPTPRNMTDVRTWFGSVCQVSFPFAVAPEIVPFRHLLQCNTNIKFLTEYKYEYIHKKKFH